MSSSKVRSSLKVAKLDAKQDDAPATTRVKADQLRTILIPRADGTTENIVVPFVQSVHHQPRPNGVVAKRVVIHCTENAELPGMARMNANLFAGPNSPEASFHYVLDNVEVIQCVAESRKAWHAPGANDDGIGIEIVGRASQTPTMWSDAYSRAALYRAMGLIADVCMRNSIPVQFLDATALRTQQSGITTHAEVTKAWPKAGHGHTDPGMGFPLEALLQGVRWTVLKLANG
jgi:N-acetyl-anhydromuramyl-L-alanine amidase AmpD